MGNSLVVHHLSSQQYFKSNFFLCVFSVISFLASFLGLKLIFVLCEPFAGQSNCWTCSCLRYWLFLCSFSRFTIPCWIHVAQVGSYSKLHCHFPWESTGTSPPYLFLEPLILQRRKREELSDFGIEQMFAFYFLNAITLPFPSYCQWITWSSFSLLGSGWLLNNEYEIVISMFAVPLMSLLRVLYQNISDLLL